mmetsp:Transcript_52126/g.124159  ORF Transcript_52126/g.124159 Transcript_52126/m.124159 type:complete len:194 (+) Transcript_52126:102-683(+)
MWTANANVAVCSFDGVPSTPPPAPRLRPLPAPMDLEPMSELELPPAFACDDLDCTYQVPVQTADAKGGILMAPRRSREWCGSFASVETDVGENMMMLDGAETSEDDCVFEMEGLGNSGKVLLEPQNEMSRRGLFAMHSVGLSTGPDADRSTTPADAVDPACKQDQWIRRAVSPCSTRASTASRSMSPLTNIAP